MSVDFFKALRLLVVGFAPVLGGSLTQLNTMSGNEYS